eukprot:6014751-Amphidinium_carterae.1
MDLLHPVDTFWREGGAVGVCIFGFPITSKLMQSQSDNKVYQLSSATRSELLLLLSCSMVAADGAAAGAAAAASLALPSGISCGLHAKCVPLTALKGLHKSGSVHANPFPQIYQRPDGSYDAHCLNSRPGLTA